MTQTLSAQNAAWIVMAFLFYEMLRLLAAHVFKRFTSNDVITHADCQECSEQKESVFAEIKEDILVMKQVLFVVAVRVGVSEDDIQKLVG